jgi:2-polyprenyl-3-methyl-5-hydroxy-6-metoxy-1,4-benzoquinol methylase
MGLFRIQHCDFEQRFSSKHFDTAHTNEWEDAGRLQEEAWQRRYQYEADVIDAVVRENPNIKSVLEIGSGPGILSQKILETHPNLTYHLVDKPFAKKYFDEHGFKGTFFVKDLSSSFDTHELLPKYDLVIANDFIEHVFNPHIIISTIHRLTNPDSVFFISNPNWRMAHQYVYRGLFDFDNFVYLLYTHMFQLEGFYGSELKTPAYPRISSETLLPDENLTDWNHYMIFKHRIENDKD